MVRYIGTAGARGRGFDVLAACGAGAYAAATDPAAPTAEHEFHLSPGPLKLSSDGVFGTWDNQQLQRGYQVYKEVCAACHSLKFVALRDLAQLGYSEAQVKAL